MKLFIAVFVSMLLAPGLGCGSRDKSASDDGGTGCNGAEDCRASEICLNRQCLDASCADNLLSSGESDVDCGGDCQPCAEGQRCLVANDCATRFCDNSGDVPLCRDCLEQDDCANADGTYCLSGLCVPRQAEGLACGNGNECANGFCVDGVCCDSACDSDCRSCSADLTGAENGVCADTLAAAGSAAECAEELPTSCGQTGLCESGACQLYGSATSCLGQSCSTYLFTAAKSCDGTGACSGPAAAACANNFRCLDATSCRTSCTLDSHCAPGYWCSGSSCIPVMAQGEGCIRSTQCASSNCKDGVCCVSSCGGFCNTCNPDGSCGGVQCDPEICCGGNQGCNNQCFLN